MSSAFSDFSARFLVYTLVALSLVAGPMVVSALLQGRPSGLLSWILDLLPARIVCSSSSGSFRALLAALGLKALPVNVARSRCHPIAIACCRLTLGLYTIGGSLFCVINIVTRQLEAGNE